LHNNQTQGRRQSYITVLFQRSTASEQLQAV
jgi:hypothetical protein